MFYAFATWKGKSALDIVTDELTRLFERNVNFPTSVIQVEV